MIRNELIRVPARASSGANRRTIGSVKDKALIRALFALLESRAEKPHHTVTVSYRGSVYYGTMKQFRDAYYCASNPVGAPSVFVRRQGASLEKANRAKAAVVVIQ